MTTNETVNLFEIATRRKYRWDSAVGKLTVEQLWDLNLTSRGGGVSLDSVAKTLHNKIKLEEEGSFVEEKSPSNIDLERKMDIIKYVIAYKKGLKEAAETAAQKAERKRLLLEALDKKKAESIANKSEEDLLKELSEL